MSLFDAYVMVDWSASDRPTSGADSVWYAEYRRQGRRLVRCALANPATRTAASRQVTDRLARMAEAGRRVLAGFDFPFGYPAGTARWLGLAGEPWDSMWRMLADGVRDADNNANNRFEFAERLNRRISGSAFPFWGHPPRQKRRYLDPRKPRAHGSSEPCERRLCEQRVPRAQPVWKLAYTGSVGGQAMTGIPHVRRIRRDGRLAGRVRVWPFETGLRDDRDAQVILAEVYPSLFAPDRLPGLPKDAGQVTAAARGLAKLDEDGQLGALLAGDPALGDEERVIVETEEAWILGVTGGPAV